MKKKTKLQDSIIVDVDMFRRQTSGQVASDNEVSKFNWSTFVYADLQYIIEMSNKSILTKLKGKTIIEDLKRFQQILHQQVQQTDVNGYFWLMLLINKLLDDDHSSIKLNNMEQIQTLDFCGLVFNAKIVDGSVKVYVERSFLRDIDCGDELILINGIPAEQYMKEGIKKYVKTTYSDLTAIKKFSLFMCIKNPFDLLNNFTFKKQANDSNKDQGKIIKKKANFYKAKQQFFSGFTNIFELMKDLLTKDEVRENQLDVSILKQGKMIYYDLHSFLSFGDNIKKIEQSLELLKSNDTEWIVVDMRNNAGGSIYLAVLLSCYLFDPYIALQYKECQNAVFNLDKDFLQRYNEQYIIPVIADPSVSKSIKDKFIKMQQYLMTKQQSLFLNAKPGTNTLKVCKKDLLTSFNRKLSKSIISKQNQIPFKKVVLITNMHCYSACVHTYSFMRLFPNVVTIGHPIGTTTGSGNSIQLQLPSKQAHIILPQLYIQNLNKKFNHQVNKKQNADIILDTDTMLSKQAIMIFILENKKNILDIITKRANSLLKQKS